MTDPAARAQPRRVRAPRGNALHTADWSIEGALRMLMNNLDPEVAERPEDLVVYGGIGKAARNWDCYERIVHSLGRMRPDETLLVQSGKPVGLLRTHAAAPRVLIANANLVPHWSTAAHFNALERQGLTMYGQMTAGSWFYIGSQGTVQGTYETYCEVARQHFGGELAGRWMLSAGLGGMGGSQPLAGRMAGAAILVVEARREPHRHAPAHRLPRPPGERAGRRAGADRASREPRRGCVDRTPGQRRRSAARAGAPCAGRRHAPRRGHRPDRRTRPAQRLHPGRLDRGRVE